MSYLSAMRLHFAGQFQAAVSTVNNDPVHYDNARFQPNFQDLQTRTELNGWFNPRGDASWRLLGCRVTSAWTGPGQPASTQDPVLACVVADSDADVPAKLVDLDPEQQLVSTVFGLEVRIATPAGDTLVRGRFEPAPFTDIWGRAQKASGGDTDAGAMYQSVLTDLRWGDTAASAFLSQLRAAAGGGLLSIKFNVDSLNMSFTSPDFMRGRIVGTIGPASAAEPHQLVLGRHLLTTSKPTNSFFDPVGSVNFCVARVDDALGRIYLDLGNALPTVAGSALADLGALHFACIVQTNQGPRLLRLDALPSSTYTDPSWYPTTAGVVELPATRQLSAQELTAVASNSLAIVVTPAGGPNTVAISEPPGGEYVRADQFVFRLSPGERQEVRLYATRFGQPSGGARVITLFEPSQIQAQAGSPMGPAPDVATPIDALDYPPLVTADEEGVALLTIGASDPGNPRGYIDGQVYGLRPVLEDTVFSPGSPYPFNPSDFVSLLVWDDFRPVGDPVTWFPSLQPVFQQFENLYPVMKRFVHLGDYESVCANRRDLVYAFGLGTGDPNYMPVTRDISPAMQAVILGWLTNPGPDGKPLRGTPPASTTLAPEAVPPPSPAPAPPPGAPAAEPPVGPRQGGKAAASSQRLAQLRPAAIPAGTAIGDLE